jgi:ketosteroid isomerase-like protein
VERFSITAVLAVMEKNPVAAARAAYEAYVRKDRAAMEALVAPDYRFTSPLDNGLDRATYFARCWPNSEQFASIDLLHTVEAGEQAFVIYEGRTKAGKRFRNCELHTVRDGRLVATEVYFGWDLPHKAKPGGFIDA